MMSILDGVPATVATAVNDLFPAASLHHQTGQVSDGRGGFTPASQTQAIKALVEDYSDYIRATAGIGSNERKVMVVGHGLPHTPNPNDIIVQGGSAWLIVEVSRDPASAIYTCRCRPVAVPT